MCSRSLFHRKVGCYAKEEKNERIEICIKGLLCLFWPETRPPSKFGGNLFCSVCVILLTIQQTNQPTTGPG